MLALLTPSWVRFWLLRPMRPPTATLLPTLVLFWRRFVIAFWMSGLKKNPWPSTSAACSSFLSMVVASPTVVVPGGAGAGSCLRGCPPSLCILAAGPFRGCRRGHFGRVRLFTRAADPSAVDRCTDLRFIRHNTARGNRFNATGGADGSCAQAIGRWERRRRFFSAPPRTQGGNAMSQTA